MFGAGVAGTAYGAHAVNTIPMASNPNVTEATESRKGRIVIDISIVYRIQVKDQEG